MICKITKVYWCEFCAGRKRKKSFRRHVIARHEMICFANPNRTPQPGEITSEWQEGRYEYDVETGAMDFIPHATMPAWWPGVDMIYTGSKWVPIPGADKSTWSAEKADEIQKTRPWIRRLHVLDISYADMPDEVAAKIREFAHEDDMREAGVW